MTSVVILLNITPILLTVFGVWAIRREMEQSLEKIIREETAAKNKLNFIEKEFSKNLNQSIKDSLDRLTLKTKYLKDELTEYESECIDRIAQSEKQKRVDLFAAFVEEVKHSKQEIDEHTSIAVSKMHEQCSNTQNKLEEFFKTLSKKCIDELLDKKEESRTSLNVQADELEQRLLQIFPVEKRSVWLNMNKTGIYTNAKDI